MNEAHTLLLVDDDDRLRERLAKAFEGRGLQVFHCDGPRRAMALARREAPDLAVVDLRMPDGNGLELVRDLLAFDDTIRVVVLTGYGSIATAVDAMRLGAVNYLTKPADADAILAAFARAEAPPLEAVEASYEVPTLARSEWELINRVLSESGGNVSEAARRLGIHRRTLQRKLQTWPPPR